MNKHIDTISTGAGLLGICLMISSGLARLVGMYYLGGFESMTLFTGGMGLMLIGIFGKLHRQNHTL